MVPVPLDSVNGALVEKGCGLLHPLASVAENCICAQPLPVSVQARVSVTARALVAASPPLMATVPAGALVSSAISAVASGETLPAPSTNLAETVLVPSAAERSHAADEAYGCGTP